MRLISCHIENFGKISNTDFEFSDGLNIICRENGWGKSTLAAFIKTMFYGFTGETKRNIHENSRKYFLPWQSGIYGGSVIFKSGKKEYRLTRIFGEKEIQDTFELRELQTNLISDDFSTKIGEDLFGINCESFMRTVFIGQNEIGTSSTDDINSKVGKLVDDSDDLSNYESALKTLTDRMNALNPRRATGSIYKRKDEITKYERLVRDEDSIRNSLYTLEKQLESEQKDLENLTDVLAKNNEVLKKISEEKAVLATKEEHSRLKDTLNTRKNAVDKAKEFFKNGVPLISDIEAELVRVNSLKSKEAEMSAFMLTQEQKDELSSLEKTFEYAKPESKDTKKAIDEITSFENELSKESYPVLNAEALNSLPDFDLDVKKINSDIIKLKNAEENLKNIEKTIDETKSSIIGINDRKQKPEILIFPGIVLLVACALIFIIGKNLEGNIHIIAGIVLGFIGICLIVFGFIKSNAKKTKLSKLEKLLREKQTQCSDSEKQLMFHKMSVKTSFSKLEKDIHLLCNQCEKYDQLSAQEHNYDRSAEKYSEIKKEIKSFLTKYGFEIEENVDVQLLKIRDMADDYYDAVKACKEVEYTLTDFENQKTEILSKQTEDILPSAEDVRRESEEINKRIDKVKKNIADYESRLGFFREKLDECEENKCTLEELKSVQDKEKNLFRITNLAKDALIKAKENMTSRYVRPLLDSFKKYCNVITGKNTENIHMDANIKVTVNEAGLQRDSELFSTGYRDLFGTALRVSLADAMYPGEKPFLIMDDPFVNLDDDKLSKVKDFLDILVQKYQIIYFTCSESRRITV